ncbi:Protein kinase [Mycena kentingensis (nom. inval.)]|nr:Protein kinase [Mycena kentingensis (nom. inval.)]
MTTLSLPPQLSTPHSFRPPAALPLLAVAPHATPDLDIWALGILFCYLFSSKGPFDYEEDKGHDGLLTEMVLRLGPFPEPLWSKWEKRAEFFDEAGNPLDTRRTGTLFDFLGNSLPRGSKQRGTFELVLRSMLCYDVSKRASAAGVLESVWIKEHCQPFMGPEEKYTVEFYDDSDLY